MPNYCYNKITIKTDNIEELQKFKEKACNNKPHDSFILSLDKLVPCQHNDIDTTDIINWRIANWGTKWDLGEVEVLYEENNEISYSCDTAWSPPIQGFLTLSKDFPDLDFHIYYEEQGNDFMGYIEIKAGETFKEIESSYYKRHKAEMNITSYEINNDTIDIAIKICGYREPSNLLNNSRFEQNDNISLNIHNCSKILESSQYNELVEELSLFEEDSENEQFANALANMNFANILKTSIEKQKLGLIIDKKDDSCILKI